MKRAALLLLLFLYIPDAALAQCGTPAPTPTETPTYRNIVLNTQAAHLIAYFPLDETTGTVADEVTGNVDDGTYSSVTLAATTFLDGSPAPAFDGINDYVDVYSSALNSAFNRAAGSILIWIRASDAAWTDGIRADALNLVADNDNFARFFNTTTNYTSRFSWSGGGTSVANQTTNTADTWHQYVLTWSSAGNSVVAYKNGSSYSSGSYPTYVGNLSPTTTVIGAFNTTPNNPWNGNIAHVAIWDVALSGSDVTALYSVPSPPAPTPTVQPTCENAPTETPIPVLETFWTVQPPDIAGTPQPGQPVLFLWQVTAGQALIGVELFIIFVLILGFLTIRWFGFRK